MARGWWQLSLGLQRIGFVAAAFRKRAVHPDALLAALGSTVAGAGNVAFRSFPTCSTCHIGTYL
jgi:hypothetical protein